MLTKLNLKVIKTIEEINKQIGCSGAMPFSWYKQKIFIDITKFSRMYLREDFNVNY